MISLTHMLGYGWDIDEEDVNLEGWDECNDTPEFFTIHLNNKGDRQYWITLSISTNDWTLTNIALWFQPKGDLKMTLLKTALVSSPSLESRFMGWLAHPEKYKDR